MAVSNPFKAAGRLFGRAISSSKGSIGRAVKSVQRVLGNIRDVQEAMRQSELPHSQRRKTLPKHGTTIPTSKKPFETRTVKQVFAEPTWGQPEISPDWQFPAGKTFFASTTDQFLGGIPMNVESEHVRWVKYVAADEQLFICFHGGPRNDLNAVYQYEQISTEYALKVWNAGDHVGTQVWTYLRRRGTVFGFQKPYTGPIGGGYSPKYEASDKWRQEHGAIPESGKLPETWWDGEGPYDPNWLLRHNQAIAPQQASAQPTGKRQRSARGKGKNPWWYGG